MPTLGALVLAEDKHCTPEVRYGHRTQDKDCVKGCRRVICQLSFFGAALLARLMWRMGLQCKSQTRLVSEDTPGSWSWGRSRLLFRVLCEGEDDGRREHLGRSVSASEFTGDCEARPRQLSDGPCVAATANLEGANSGQATH